MAKQKPEKFKLDKKKMKELILYISSENEDAPEFGATVLNKMLYYADLTAYLYLGKPITGDKYIRRSFGPTPRSLLPLREELIQQEALEIQERSRMGHVQHRPVSLRGPDMSMFTTEEIEIIDDVISELKGVTGKRLSDLTHDELTWKNWDDGEEIPYEAFFLRKKNPISKDTMEWAKAVASKSRFAKSASRIDRSA